MSKHLFLFIIIVSLVSLSTQATRKQVEDLFDGLYSGEVYSGYLNTLKENQTLFYIYTPSQNKPDTDPLFLWLNGGPGCSSLFGMLGEIGPVIFDRDSGEMKLNPFSWNKNSNLLFIEQPAGVGFSETDDPEFMWNDDIMAENLLFGLKDFINEFQLKGRPLYITGESYAGVYVPYLATYILKDTSEEDKVNLKGIFVGNGLTDGETDIERSMVDFAYYHGITSLKTYNSFKENCPHLPDLLTEFEANNIEENDEPILKDSFFERNVTKKCNEVRKIISKDYQGLDIYGIYRDCPQKENKNNSEGVANLGNKYNMKNTIYRNLKKKSLSKKRKYLSKFKDEEEEFENEIDVFPTLCDSLLSDIAINNFLNNKTIKEKLGVHNISTEWIQCTGISYPVGESLFFYRDIMTQYPDVSVWVFSGTDDALLSTLGTIRWINKLNLGIEEEWREWKVKDQVGGFVQKYNSGLVLATVKGAGHMVPQDQSEAAFVLVSAFLNGTLP